MNASPLIAPVRLPAGPRRVPLGAVLAATFLSCALPPEQAAERLQASVDARVAGELAHLVLWVDAPRLGLDRGFVAGQADPAEGRPMTLETPFLSASVGKMVLATGVMRLVAEGRLRLDDPISRWVSWPEVAGLPVEGGDAALAQVTVEQLLTHRSGLPDYFSDPSADGAPRLFERIAQEPDRSWTRPQLFDYARAHYRAVGAPGQRFHYADTNYDLLGMVLEGATGRPFHQAVRALVLEPLELRETWYHAFEAAPPGLVAPAGVWVDGVNLQGTPALSVDQAGGGLMTTVGDLRRLVRALQVGRPVPLSALATAWTEDAMHPGIDVGRGAWRIRPGGLFLPLSTLPTLVGHSGATGIWAYFAEDWDVVLVGAASDDRWQERHVEFLLRDVLPVLARVPYRAGEGAP